MSTTTGLLDFGKPAGDVLAEIREHSRDEAEKGRWFELLFAHVARRVPDLEVEQIWPWSEWPDRESMTGLGALDLGIDLVAQMRDGTYTAIQCKCYASNGRVAKPDVDSFLAVSSRECFSYRWIVATCPWNANAEAAIQGVQPGVGRIDFGEYEHILVEEKIDRPVREPWPQQQNAIEAVIEGLTNHDRGLLVMACGTGKTFTALRIAEKIVPDDGHVLFLAPSIALVAQARREWLRYAQVKIETLIVCSDRTAGRRDPQIDRADITTTELECAVTTSPKMIAKKIRNAKGIHATFCTYQSLAQVIEAQNEFDAPTFDLTLCDEAHRTTGVQRDDARVSFQAVHDSRGLRSSKRLYMTATPRIYTEASKRSAERRNLEVIDMTDEAIYGPELYRLRFADAVDSEMLSDYRVIVLGVDESTVSEALQERLERNIEVTEKQKNRPTVRETTRVLGTSLAIHGAVRGKRDDRPGALHRTLVFANTINRSKWYRAAFDDQQVKARTTRALDDGKALKVVATHLDASNSALERNKELRRLRNAHRTDTSYILSNVKLFTEGVDVPSLNAVAFLDPRDSQVDVVQAVGRVMRKSPSKRFGYIIVPVVIEPGQDVAAALEEQKDGYHTVGKVMRALRSHDERLTNDLYNFVQVYEPPKGNGGSGPPGTGGGTIGAVQQTLDLSEASGAIYAHVAASSGLAKPGLEVSERIEFSVREAAKLLRDENAAPMLAARLNLGSIPEGKTDRESTELRICTIAALLLCNASLLHRRLLKVENLKSLGLPDLGAVMRAANPAAPLKEAWDRILERDYSPVFNPGVDVVESLPNTVHAHRAIRTIVTCANDVADSLSEMGYDHAGPLYHRVLRSAKSDGAFYTNNLSALLLADLAIGPDFADWTSPKAVESIRIMDPACGTGTLLMASLRTIKDRFKTVGVVGEDERIHRSLVEDVLCGLDINQHGVQLAACNLTLGAPTVDYGRMNLMVMKHGRQPDGKVYAGSLEILATTSDEDSVESASAPIRSLDGVEAERLVASNQTPFPLHDLNLVIMNAPFTDNKKRNTKFSTEEREAMQAKELEIRDIVAARDALAGNLVTANSVRTFFSPLADLLLSEERGTLAKVIPTTATIGASGLPERIFLADRFHVELVVTSHDPHHLAFSENTGIHESLLVCRRRSEGRNDRATKFVSLREMPSTPEEVKEIAEMIRNEGASGKSLVERWGRVFEWPDDRIMAGNWTPAQWYDGALCEAALSLDHHASLKPLGQLYKTGPSGQAAQDSWVRAALNGDENEIKIFDSISSRIRSTILGEPDQVVRPGGRREHLWENVLRQSGRFLVATRWDIVGGKLTGLYTDRPTFGFGWIPVRIECHDTAKALAVWWNSTPCLLALLNRRSRKLTYPKYSIKQLESIPIPDPHNVNLAPLVAAFEEHSCSELREVRFSSEDKTRIAIDDAAAEVTGIPQELIADWRQRIAREPTVRNERCPV